MLEGKAATEELQEWAMGMGSILAWKTLWGL